MNTQVNILHTGGNSLQQASSQADPSIREAPAQTDQPIRQEEAHPDIKDHLAAAPGNRVEGDVLPIAESVEKDAEAVSYNPLEAVEGIEDDKQPGAVYLRVAQDSQEPTSSRLWAVWSIEDSDDRHAVYLSIIQDSQAYIADRLMAAHRIKVETGESLFDALYPDFPEYLEVNSQCRLWAAELIKDPTERDNALIDIAKDPEVHTHYGLEAAKLIANATERDNALIGIAKDLEVEAQYRLEAAKLIANATERDKALIDMAKDPEVEAQYRLEAAKLIANATERDNALFAIAQDEVVARKRLETAKLIENRIQCDVICLSIAQDPKISAKCRMEAAEQIQAYTSQHDEAYLSIAQDPKISADCRIEAANRIQKHNIIQRDQAYLSIAQDTNDLDSKAEFCSSDLLPEVKIVLPEVKIVYWDHLGKSRLNVAEQIQEVIQRDRAYSYIAEDPEVDINDRLEAAGEIKNNPIQGESYRSIIETLLSRDAFGCMEQLITVVQGIPNIQVKNLVMKAIYQNWPLVEEGQLQEHLLAFRRLYELASDDGRTDLITAIVTRTQLDAGFRKAVVEEHVKDAAEQERLVKAIEEGQEGSLNGPRNKRAW